MKLLIVDDSAMIRRAIHNSYKGTVFTEIETAADGLLALTVFKNQMPDVVTLDITMPHMDGLAAMSQMLEIKPNTIILVISALADHHTAIESLCRGAHQFICKPFADQELMEALDSLLGDVEIPKSKSVMESDSSSNNILDRINSNKVEVEAIQIPVKKDYPSGYVEPPVVEKKSLMPKDSKAVTRRASLSDILRDIQKDSV